MLVEKYYIHIYIVKFFEFNNLNKNGNFKLMKFDNNKYIYNV